ncbi:MAG: rhodanese-like domain-containing protein [Bacteroidota bacterium]
MVHCQSGKRSAQAVHYLQENGFTNIFNLSGGINAIEQYKNSVN